MSVLLTILVTYIYIKKIHLFGNVFMVEHEKCSVKSSNLRDATIVFAKSALPILSSYLNWSADLIFRLLFLIEPCSLICIQSY